MSVPTNDLIAEAVADVPRLATRAEAARAIRRSVRWIDRLIQTGQLRVLRPAGSGPLIPRRELERLLRADGAAPGPERAA